MFVFIWFIVEVEMFVWEIFDSVVVSVDIIKFDCERIFVEFKVGKIKVVVNVGVFIIGFDYLEFDIVVFCRFIMLFLLYYQMVGCVICLCFGKNGWVIDLCGNIRIFGKVEDLRVE